MIEKQPKVSVIMSTYNHANFIGDAIFSVLRQGIKDIEIIVINNFSEDNTLEVIARFKDDRIKVINFRNNGILAASRNVGLREAKGDFIAFLDSDDIWFDDKLKVQLKILEKNSDLLAVCGNAEYLPHQGIRKYLFVKLLDHRYSFKDFLISNRVINSSLLMRREVLDKIGFLDDNKDLFAIEDYDYWLRMVQFKDKSIYLMRRPLIYYRVHNSNNFMRGEKEFEKLKKIFQKYEAKYPKFIKKVCEYRKYYIKVIDLREKYRTGILNKIELFRNNEIKFFDKLDIIFKTVILKVIKNLGRDTNKKNIAFVVYGNVDYLTDYIEHAQNLAKFFNVYLICSKVYCIQDKNVNIIEIKQVTSIGVINKFYFFCIAFWKVLNLQISNAIVLYNRFSFIFGLLAILNNIFNPNKIRTWYDLRSGSVSGKLDNFKNFLHMLESLFFSERIAISAEVSELVFKTKKNVHIIGLGCSKKIILSEDEKFKLKESLKISENDIVFVYCGTFTNRELDVFLDKFDLKDNFKIIFIGDGDINSVNKLKQKVDLKMIQDKVVFTGRILYPDLYKFYNIADVGISYIPKLKMYEYQPPTKIFEYAEYNLSIIATKTFANEKISKEIGQIYFWEDYKKISDMGITKQKKVYNLEPFSWDKFSDKWKELLLNNLNYG